MAQSRSTLVLPLKNGVANSGDPLVFVYSYGNSTIAQTALITIDHLFSNTPNLHVVAANLEMNDFRPTDPANSSILAVEQGTIFFTNSYGYYAVANNQLKRWPISDF